MTPWVAPVIRLSGSLTSHIPSGERTPQRDDHAGAGARQGQAGHARRRSRGRDVETVRRRDDVRTAGRSDRHLRCSPSSSGHSSCAGPARAGGRPHGGRLCAEDGQGRDLRCRRRTRRHQSDQRHFGSLRLGHPGRCPDLEHPNRLARTGFLSGDRPGRRLRADHQEGNLGGPCRPYPGVDGARVSACHNRQTRPRPA